MDKSSQLALELSKEMIVRYGEHVLNLIDNGCYAESQIGELLLALVGWDVTDLVRALQVMAPEEGTCE